MTSEDEVLREIGKKRRAIWLGILLFGLCGIVGLFGGGLLLTVGGFGFVAAGVVALDKLKGFGQAIADYHPGQGFGYFRKTREEKMKVLTRTQYGLAFIVLLCILFRISIDDSLISGIGGILFIQYYIKGRIRLHTPIDEASLFELEEIGVISSEDRVKAIYKDFESWEQAEKGSKILLVTQDSLVCVIMENKEEAIRMECRMKEIRKLGVIGHGEQGEGLLVSIGTLDNRTIRVKLDGASALDSPEVFFQQFLQALDEALASASEPAKPRSRTVELRKGKTAKPGLHIRGSDFFDLEASAATSANRVE
ncbi:hypothetical protein [Cohnella cellulosilytica]|uniref:Uncharacterized protein n=1 Tax=Cohnella cellulosilytica TaxID=986710 RepID=A0ABW2FDL4_9BACL